MVETSLYVSMNIYLLWMWHKTGQLDTLVNKLVCIQRVCGILYSVGCLVDYFFRLDETKISFYFPANICSCWMMYYKFLINLFHTSQLAMALVRFICIKYPIEYHNRYIVHVWDLFISLHSLLRFPNDESKQVLFKKVLLSILTMSFLFAALDQASIYCL